MRLLETPAFVRCRQLTFCGHGVKCPDVICVCGNACACALPPAHFLRTQGQLPRCWFRLWGHLRLVRCRQLTFCGYGVNCPGVGSVCGNACACALPSAHFLRTRGQLPLSPLFSYRQAMPFPRPSVESGMAFLFYPGRVPPAPVENYRSGSSSVNTRFSTRRIPSRCILPSSTVMALRSTAR